MLAVHKLGFEWGAAETPQKIGLIKAVLAEDTWIWICVIRLIPVAAPRDQHRAALSDLRPVAVFSKPLGYLPQMLLLPTRVRVSRCTTARSCGSAS